MAVTAPGTHDPSSGATIPSAWGDAVNADLTSLDTRLGSKALEHYKQVGTSPLERYHVAGLANATPLVTGAPTVGILRAIPFVSPRGGTVDRIAVNVTASAVGSVLKCAIYNATSETNLYPSSLLVAGAEQLGSTTGMKAATISQALTAGALYWFVHWAGTAAPTLRCLALAGMEAVPLGLDNVLAVTPGVGIQATLAYGVSFPATFTAGGTVITAVPIPAIAVRFSA